MKRAIIFLTLAAVLAGGSVWLIKAHLTPPPSATDGRKILYYQSPMHPWIKSDKPGKCPICGMNLVPVYASVEGTNTGFGLRLNSDSVNVANVETSLIARRQIIHSLRVAGIIETNAHSAWFVFNASEREFAWLAGGQTVEVTLPALPGQDYPAAIAADGLRAGNDNRSDLAQGISVRAKMCDSQFGGDVAQRGPAFNGFYAEGRVIADTPEVLAVPRSAVLSPGEQPVVYVDVGGGRFEPHKVKLGRIGDEFAEVLDGLQVGEKVVTSGNLLIDAEAQISQSTDGQPSLP